MSDDRREQVHITDKAHNILIGVATYDGKIHTGILTAVMHSTRSMPNAVVMHQSSASAHGFNQMWQMALNGRRSETNATGFTHFVLIHSDVEPSFYWMDKMVELMDEKNMDILSVVIPIKTSAGITSTAIDEPPPGDWDPRWTVRRYTMKEIYDLEPTFTHPKLLVNNGLIMVDLSKPWVEEVFFRTELDMIKDKVTGKFNAVTFSEDWYFSREALKRGAKIWATREVEVNHHGTAPYPNTAAWGTEATDSPHPQAQLGGPTPSSAGIEGIAV